MKEVIGALVLAIAVLACGRERDEAPADPVTADVSVASPSPEVPEAQPIQPEPTAPSEVTPEQEQTPEAKAPAPEPTTPVFDAAAYLAGQEAAMLAFVEKLKAIRVYDAPPEFLKPTVEQSKVGVHYGSPFTSAEPNYKGYISQPSTNSAGCANIQGSTHHQITTLWEVGTFPGRFPLGLEYRLVVAVRNGSLAIIAVDAHWKTLDGKNHYYDLGVTCEDGTPVLPAVSASNF